MQRFITLLLYLTLTVAPLCVGSYFGQYRYPLLILSWLCLLMALGSRFLYKKPKKLLYIPILILWVMGIWMTWNSEGVFTRDPWYIAERLDQPFLHLPGAADLTSALDSILYILPFLGIVYICYRIAQAIPRFTSRVCQVIFITGVLVALIGMFQKITTMDKIYGFVELHIGRQNLFFGTFRSPGIASCYLNIALSLGLGVFLRSTQRARTPAKVIFSCLGCFIILTGVVATGSKAGIILSLLTLILWAFLNKNPLRIFLSEATHLLFKGRKVERNCALLMLGFVASIGGLLSIQYATTRFAQANENKFASLDARIEAYTTQLSMLKDSGWLPLGYGPGSFMPYYPYFSDRKSGEVWVYAHNDFLQTAIEWGPIGFLCFTMIIGYAVFVLLMIHFKKYGEPVARTRMILLRSIFVALLTTLIHATVDFPLQIESIAFTFAVLIGIAWAHTSQRQSV